MRLIPGRRRSPDDVDDSGSPVLITRAQPSHEDQIDKRKRRYLILMAVRFPLLFLGGYAYMEWNSVVLALLCIVISVPLPWLAVVGANTPSSRAKGEPRRYIPADLRAATATPALPPAVTGQQTTGSEPDDAPNATQPDEDRQE